MHNNSKKILFIGKRSFNNTGSYDYEYLRRLTESKLNFSVIYACSNLYDQKKINQIKYFKLFKYNELPIIKKCFSYTNSLIKLLKLIQRYKPDVIHLQWLLFPLVDLIWLKVIKLIGWRGLTVITIHNAKSRQSSITNYFLKICYKQIDHFIVHSHKCKEYLVSRYDFLKSYSIFEGRHGIINLKNFENLNNEELRNFSKICELRRKYKNLYIYVGNLSKYKGFDLLINAWKNYKKLSQDKENSGLIILGKADKNVSKFLSKNKLKDSSILIYNNFVSDKLISLTVDNSDYIFLIHRYISHSGIHSSLLKKCKPFIYNNNNNNHMISHKNFKNTGIAFENDIFGLTELFLNIESNKIKYEYIEKNWEEAIDYFSWENSFPDKLLLRVYDK
tara:strand:+ start:2829 stop:3998 length:1170 start_codon:yes stop_codon:yes gene_type:complete